MRVSLSLALARQMSLNQGGIERAVGNHKAGLGRAQERLATGLRVNRASDDPSSFGEARRLETVSRRYEQYTDTIGTARFWLNSTQDALDSLADRFTEAYERGVQAQNDALSDSDRELIASSLEETFTQVLDELNTKIGDEYLFGGTNTTAEPFARDGGAGADASGVSYFGNGNERTLAIGDGIEIEPNTAGSTVANAPGGTITEHLQSLVDAVRSGDSAAIETSIGSVVEARDHLLSLGSAAGARAERMNVVEEQLQTATLWVEGRRSEAEDADMAETVVSMQSAENNLQAALRALATVGQVSIFDYLR